MSFNIAVAGKGGSGKTTIASLVIRYLKYHASGPILAVDADPNANLGDSLGLNTGDTVGSILALFQKEKIGIPPGLTKEAYLNYKLNEIIVESQGLDLVSMGRGEGRECYCYPNTVLRKFIDDLADNYAYMVMDNEAGMEHLSRATTQNVDELLLVSDHSIKGIRSLARIGELITELGLAVKRQSVVINRVPGDLDPLIRREIAELGMETRAVVPRDDAVYSYDLKLTPILNLPDSSVAVKAIDGLMSDLMSNGNTGLNSPE